MQNETATSNKLIIGGEGYVTEPVEGGYIILIILTINKSGGLRDQCNLEETTPTWTRSRVSAKFPAEWRRYYKI